MNSPLPMIFGPRQLRRATGLILVLWTLAIAASVAWNSHLLRDAMFEAAAHDVRNSFNKDVLHRRWAASHGGVYVPVTAVTPPNPYLTNIVERDLVTPSGRRLTLMNPAYMTRQVHELGRQYGSQGHITSLKPLRPENAPDAWEADALRTFEQGRTEVMSREPVDGEPHLRLMKPLIVEASCLKCHAAQGYKEGEIRGGISVAVPLAQYLAVAQVRIRHIAGVHTGLWALGVLGIFLGSRQMRQRLDKQLQAEEALRKRVRELNCLYAIADLIENEDSLEKILKGSADVLPKGWFYPEIACARISFDGREYQTENFRATDWRQSVALKVDGQPSGTIDLCYLEERPARDEGPFFKEERTLINAIAERLGRVAERKRVEDKLRQLSRAMEQSPASIVITDSTGDIEYVNPKFIQVTGYTLAEVLGKNPRVLKSGEKSPEDYRELWQIITTGKEWRGEFHNKRKNGELYWESASISPIRDPAGHITHFVAVKEDITAWKKTEAERDHLILDLQSAIANVKSLSGLLPICASCKKIRDDKGYWDQVEIYVQKHSEARFSHGMCPDCIKKWYPEFENEDPGGSSKGTP